MEDKAKNIDTDNNDNNAGKDSKPEKKNISVEPIKNSHQQKKQHNNLPERNKPNQNSLVNSPTKASAENPDIPLTPKEREERKRKRELLLAKKNAENAKPLTPEEREERKRKRQEKIANKNISHQIKSSETAKPTKETFNKPIPDYTQPVIILENVGKTFYIREKPHQTIRDRVFNLLNPNSKRKIEALEKLNITVYKGEIFGIIGRNGSGKSTLIHLITGAYEPDTGGKVTLKGKYMRMSLGMGFNRELTAKENVYINSSVLGLSIAEINKRFDGIIEFAELKDFVNTKIKFFSKGMVARLSFAIAVHADADIYLMDEFFGGVGDEGFKKKADEEFKKAFLTGKTIVQVSHSLETIKNYCNRVLLLDKGKVLALGTPEEVIPKYKELFGGGVSGFEE